MSMNSLKIFSMILLASMVSCTDFVSIERPRTDLVRDAVFTDDLTATSAVIDVYYQLRGEGFASGDNSSISFLTALSADETVNYNTGSTAQEFQQFNENKLLASGSLVTSLWTELYECIYKTNSIIEGLEQSSGVSENTRLLLTGEAKFLRAFCYFYLVNLWGDVPLALTTDYRENTRITRSAIETVYEQITIDLIDAQSLLPDDYSLFNNERIRVNKMAATALLARVYLYMGDWGKAEEQATTLISSSLFDLVPLDNVFLKNSEEAIWQLQPIDYPYDLFYFYIFGTYPDFVALTPSLVDVFDGNDLRRNSWIGIATDESGSYHFPTKYKSFNAGEEQTTILRLAEQYLIRAEARAHLDNISGGLSDVNEIRNRAGLDDAELSDKQSLLSVIEDERRRELFTEWGHRWLDLKRTGRIADVLAPLKQGWTSNASLYPIPESQLLNAPEMRDSQNPGY